MVSDSNGDPSRGSVPPGAPGTLVAVGAHPLATGGDPTVLGGASDFGLLAALRRKYRVVLGVGATTFALVMAATLLSTMEFGASSRLYLGELDGKTRSSVNSAEDLELALGGQSDLGSEIEILRSRSLVWRAVHESGLNIEVSRLGSSPVRYWKWRLSGRDPSLLDAADKELRGVRAQLTDESQKERRFEVVFVSAAEFELWSPEVRGIRTRIPGQLLSRGRIGEPLVLPGLELTLRGGSEGSPEPGARYQVLVRPLEDAVDSALKTLEVSAPKSSGSRDPVKVVTLTFRQASPTLAAEFLEQLMKSYLGERQAWKTADASAVEAFVTEQLQSTRTLLDDIQRKLADYRLKNRAVVLDNEAKAMITQIGKYEEQRVAARLELSALVDVDRALAAANLPIEAYMLGEAKDSVLEEFAGSLAKARRDLTDLEVRYNSSAPIVREQRAQVTAQLATIRSYVRARVRRAEDNLKTLDSIIQQYEDKLRTVPEAELGLAQLTRESQVYGALYSNLLMRQQQTAIVKASTVSRNRVLDPARVGYLEESPRLPLRLLSGVFGLVLGAGLVVLGRLLSNSFSSEAEVQNSLSPLPVLANVPKRRQRWARRPRRAREVPFDLLGGDVNFEFVEAFRALRTRLYQTALAPEGGQVLLVTSPNRGDGKTTVVLSLASVLAADGKSVLVLDVDLRQGKAPSGLDAPREADLRAALIGQCTFQEAVQRMTVAGGEYDFLGPDGAAPVELLASARMTEFLDDARLIWDYVLIDVPSFPLVSDALSLAPAVDAVLTVIRLDATSARTALEHARRLSTVARAHALIVNDPGSRWGKGQSYGATPERAFSKTLDRWTWRDWDATDASGPRRGRVARAALPFLTLLLLALVGVAAAWPSMHDDEKTGGARAAGPGSSLDVTSSIRALSPAPAGGSALPLEADPMDVESPAASAVTGAPEAVGSAGSRPGLPGAPAPLRAFEATPVPPRARALPVAPAASSAPVPRAQSVPALAPGMAGSRGVAPVEAPLPGAAPSTAPEAPPPPAGVPPTGVPPAGAPPTGANPVVVPPAPAAPPVPSLAPPPAELEREPGASPENPRPASAVQHPAVQHPDLPGAGGPG
jgi:tyrosine-protein kinase Etk/Wzc